MPPEMGREADLEEAALRPRQRLVKIARELFYKHGIHAVGVDAIADAAATNKATLYRHFRSKDELVAECLREYGRELDTAWDEIALRHRGDPMAQLRSWLRYIADFKLDTGGERGCALINAAIELPDPDHPARRVVEELKGLHRTKFIELCREAGLRRPELLADELFLLCEGARVSIQSVGAKGPTEQLAEMFETLVKAHLDPVA